MASVVRGKSRPSHLRSINLAAALHDGAHVHVPRFGEVLPTPTPYGLSADGWIDINLADPTLLETLPGIGPTIAQRIIEYREMNVNDPFESIEQLLGVQGNCPAEYDEIKDLVTIGEPLAFLGQQESEGDS